MAYKILAGKLKKNSHFMDSHFIGLQNIRENREKFPLYGFPLYGRSLYSPPNIRSRNPSPFRVDM